MWQCPKCNSTVLSVTIQAEARLNQDEDGNVQTEVEGDQEWAGTALMRCRDCDYRSVAANFEVPEEEGEQRYFALLGNEDIVPVGVYGSIDQAMSHEPAETTWLFSENNLRALVAKAHAVLHAKETA